MATLKFSITSENIEAAQSAGGEPAPPGFYSAEITSCEHEKPRGKAERIHVQYRIFDEAENYATLHEYIVIGPTTEWKMTQFLVAVGVATKAGDVNWDPAKQVGKKVRIRAINETYSPEGGQERITAKPQGVWPIGAGSGGGQKAASNGGEDRLAQLQNMTEDELLEIEEELTALATPLDIDPDTYATWEEVVVAIANSNGVEAEAEADETAAEAAEAEGVQDPRWLEILALGEDELADIADELEGYNTDNLDVDSYDTWEEYREALNDVLNEGGTEADTTEAEDYGSWAAEELRNELKARGLDTKGSPSVLVKRIQENDAEKGPFG